MSDSNPYAPPAVGEPEAPSSLTWRLDGAGLLVKNRVVLPMVDLETGEHGADMKCIHRIYRVANAFSVMRIATLSGVYLLLGSFYHFQPAVTIPIIIALSFVLQQFRAMQASPADRVVIWEFVGAKTVKGRIARSKGRSRIALAVVTAMILFPLLFPSTTLDFTRWTLRILGTGAAVLAGVWVWALIDRPGSKSHAGPPGWMRISPIHADAFVFLSLIENRQRQESTAQPEARKRLVRTSYFHRYPLRILLGNKKNPLILFRIALMKLVRSPLLVRETYPFSEAEPSPVGRLCKPLQGAIKTWLSLHPDWIFLSAERLPSPSGEVTVECATLTTPGLEHSALITHAWAAMRLEQGMSQFSFVTWLADGSLVRTNDHPFIDLSNPRVHETRAKGPPERVFLAHLRRCAGQSVSAARDPEELHARILRTKEESDRIITEMGLQSEAREVA